MTNFNLLHPEPYIIKKRSGRKIAVFEKIGLKIHIAHDFPQEKLQEKNILIGTLKKIGETGFKLLPGNNFVFCIINDFGTYNHIKILYPSKGQYWIFKEERIYGIYNRWHSINKIALIETPQFPVICEFIFDYGKTAVFKDIFFIEPDESKITAEYLNKLCTIIENLKIQ